MTHSGGKLIQMSAIRVNDLSLHILMLMIKLEKYLVGRMISIQPLK